MVYKKSLAIVNLKINRIKTLYIQITDKLIIHDYSSLIFLIRLVKNLLQLEINQKDTGTSPRHQLKNSTFSQWLIESVQ